MIDLKEKLNNRELTIGSWLSIGNSYTTEIMVQAGFEWLVIDMEHSAITMTEAQQMIQTIELGDCVPLVRVGSNDPTLIKRVLDAGAHGVIVPMVNTAEEAEAAVRAAKYPPRGTRGVGLARAQRYGISFNEYKKWNEEKSVVIVQTEHIDAVNNLEDILAVDGVDGFIIGPYDLSGSLGYPGEFDRPEMRDALARVREIGTKYGKAQGYHSVPINFDDAKSCIDDGYTFLAVGVDFLYLGESCRGLYGELKEFID